MRSGREEGFEAVLGASGGEVLSSDDVVGHVGVHVIERGVNYEDEKSCGHPHRYAGYRGAIPPRHRFGALCLAVILGCVLGACGQDRVSAAKNTTKATVMVPMQSKIPLAPVDSTIGQSVKTDQGNVITVYQLQSPAAYAESGFVIAAADVGVCAASTTVVTQEHGVVVHAGISPQFFSVQFDDGTVQEAQAQGTKDPALPQQLLQPGQCVRGWVTFHIPEQKKVNYVLFRSLSVIRWRLS
jgi:hypothetical protein